MSLKAMTANRLRDGVVVYLIEDGLWSERLADSYATEDAAEQDRLVAVAERAAAAREIVTPYLMPVALVDGRPAPISRREIIRGAGPSVRSDFR